MKTYSAEEVARILQYEDVGTVYRKKELERVKQKRRLVFTEEAVRKYMDARTIPGVLTDPLPEPTIRQGVNMPRRIRTVRTGYGTSYCRKSKRWGVRFYADYTPPGRARIREVVKTAKSHEDVLSYIRRRISADWHCNGREDRSGVDLRFEDWTKEYLETYAVHKRSLRTDQWLASVLNARFGQRLLGEVAESDLYEYRRDLLKRGWAGSSTNRALALVSKLYNLARRRGLVNHNPAEYLPRLSEAENKIERVLTPAEEGRLLAAAESPLREMAVLALNTGLRLGEVLALRWTDCDFRTHALRVAHSKSKKPRYVRMNTIVEDTLRMIKAIGEYVFTNPKTKTRYSGNAKMWHRALKAARIEGVRFHDLRHTFATRLAENRVPLHRLKKILGHSDIRLTERYTHTTEDDELDAVQSLVEETIPVGESRKVQ